MTKFRKSLLIFGIIALIIGVALGTFIVLSLTDSLKAEQISLEFTVDDAIKEYDGEPLTATSYSISEGYLIEGHMPVVSFTGGQTDVGNSFSGLDVKIVNEKGYDVSKEYKIKVNSGILSVFPCSVQVTLTKQEVYYDGNKIDIGDGYAVTGGMLAKGHRVSAQINDSWFASVGKIVAGNTLTADDVDLLIFDGNGRNVTGNYAIMLRGRVGILKRPLVLSPVSAEKIYDGKPLECSQYKIDSGSLASGDYIDAKFETESGLPAVLINVSTPLEIKVRAIIYDINGDDVTENYEWRSTSGYLTVNKAPLTITAKSGSWLYDGEVHSLADDDRPENVIGLVSGEQLTVNYSGSVTDVSVVENIIEGYTILDELNGTHKENNYDVRFINGKLEVSKAPLTVKLKALEKEYDGEPFDFELSEIYTISSTIENLELQFDDKEYLKKLFNGVTEIGNSTYTFSDFKILNGGADVTDKFNIDVVTGNMKIMRREVALQVGELKKQYDGNFVFSAGEQLSFDKPLAKGHRFESITCEPVLPSEDGSPQSASIRSFTLVDAQGNNAMGYYNVTNLPESVNVIITARDLEVSTGDFEKVYDTLPLSGGAPVYGMLASGDRLEYKPLEVTDYCEPLENVPEITIYNGNNEDVTAYYNFIKNYGKLTIRKKQIDVYFSADCEVEYKEQGINGTDLFDKIRCDELDPNLFHIVNDTYYGVGPKEVNFEFVNANDNYEIVSSNNQFTIVRTRTANFNDNTEYKIYDRNPLKEEDLALANMRLTLNDTDGYVFASSNLTDTEYIDAGEYDAEIVYKKGEGYERIIVKGKYKIKPYIVTVSAKNDISFVYNGKNNLPDVNQLKVNESLGGEKYSVKSFVSANNDIIDAKKHTLKFKSVELVVDGTGEAVKEKNVQVDLQKSEIEVEVTGRELTITLSPLNGTPSGPVNPWGLINIFNLADGDTPDFENVFISVQGNMTVLTTDEIIIKRNGKDVTKNYIMLPEIEGAITN